MIQVALIVGEFDIVSDTTKAEERLEDGYPNTHHKNNNSMVIVNVYTPIGKSAQGSFALSVATKCLSFFAATFGIPYPLKKLDMVAIPDFAAGAMENWGCITYREEYVLLEQGIVPCRRHRRMLWMCPRCAFTVRVCIMHILLAILRRFFGSCQAQT
jgi:aminopeptidase N